MPLFDGVRVAACFLFLIFTLFFQKGEGIEPSLSATIEAHLVIHNDREVVKLCEKALLLDPLCPQLWGYYLEALGRSQEENKFFKAWKEYVSKGLAKDKKNLEIGAWGALELGAKSASPLVRMTALIGAALVNDARSVKFLLRSLTDSNKAVRAIAVEISSQFLDDSLKEAVLGRLFEEKEEFVRFLLIQAVGSMRLFKAKSYLLSILENDQTKAEERLEVVKALAELEDAVSLEWLALLAKAQRSGLRLLACHFIHHFHVKEAKSLLISLSQDAHPEVRFFAIQAMGSFTMKEMRTTFEQALLDPQEEVVIAASWALLLQGSEKAEETFKQKIFSSSLKIQRLAAAALSAGGQRGAILAKELALSFQIKDPFVQLSLARALATESQSRPLACEMIVQVLKSSKERWKMASKGVFEWIEPSSASLALKLPGDWEIENLRTRLELLNLLAIFQFEKVQEAIEVFLQENEWGVAAGASALLLTEGDSTAVDAVKALLTSNRPKICIQSALILAMWGKDEEAISCLEKSYDTSSREIKEKILEGLGSIGALTSIPFLAEKMHGPYPILRLIAASSILRCLYH